ncbi:hypothetical protein RRG08_011767 [Elysia crispata]|uniref:Uncharacterized protein n=1 Tax=Elysia crispata TaxID=231223 RepID=A0AAE0ZR15_9GAST|nr:hypothetical protein RRG08_011767 [Elysia crispata]
MDSSGAKPASWIKNHIQWPNSERFCTDSSDLVRLSSRTASSVRPAVLSSEPRYLALVVVLSILLSGHWAVVTSRTSNSGVSSPVSLKPWTPRGDTWGHWILVHLVAGHMLLPVHGRLLRGTRHWSVP